MSDSGDLLAAQMQSQIDSGQYSSNTSALQSAGVALGNGLQNAGAMISGQSQPPQMKLPQSQQNASAQQNPLADMKNQMNQTSAPPPPNMQAPPDNSAPPSSGVSMSSGAAMGAMGAAMSDENVKKNVKETDVPDIDRFVQSLTPKSYDYKDNDDGSHTEGGLMAQDLLKSKIGASTVIKTPRGLAVDAAKLTPIIAAVMSHKVKELESKIDGALSKRFKGK